MKKPNSTSGGHNTKPDYRLQLRNVLDHNSLELSFEAEIGGPLLVVAPHYAPVIIEPYELGPEWGTDLMLRRIGPLVADHGREIVFDRNGRPGTESIAATVCEPGDVLTFRFVLVKNE